jgi:ABC-type nitrate/sulfonate/bicarbonate transport system substrate-binding protein
MGRVTGIFATIALAAVALVLVPGAVGAKQATTRITVCYANAATDFTALLASAKEGFAEAEGLEIVPRLALGVGPQLLQNGTCQIGIGSGPEHMLLYAAGYDAALVAGWQNRFGFKLLVRTDRGINKAADLRGKKLAVSTIGGPPDQSARALLKTLNLVPDRDVDIVYIPNITARLAAISQGSVDGAIFSPPVKQVTASGNVKDILDLSFLRWISLGVWTERKYAVNNAGVVKGFLRAAVKTNRWLIQPQNKEKVIGYISEMTGIRDREGLEEAYAYGILEHLPREPVVDPVALRNSVNYTRDQFGKTVDPDDFTYFRLLDQVLTYTLTGSLGPRAEVPKPRRAAASKATFRATLKQNGRLTWRLTMNRLSRPATAAHLHLGAAGKAGPVRLTLCTKCKVRNSGTARVGSGLSNAIKAGQVYVNVHTPTNPAGEVRAQLVAEPGR